MENHLVSAVQGSERAGLHDLRIVSCILIRMSCTKVSCVNARVIRTKSTYAWNVVAILQDPKNALVLIPLSSPIENEDEIGRV